MRSASLLWCGVCLGALVLPGCIQFRSPVQLPYGAIYSNYKVPLTTNFDSTPCLPSRVGRANTFFLRLPFTVGLAFDDASIERAAQNGNIREVHYADVEFTQVMGVWGTYETIVYGE